MDNDLKKWIFNNLFSKNKLNSKRVEKDGNWVKTHFPEKYSEIKNITNFLEESPSFSERIYCIINDINYHPVCSVCKNKVGFEKFSKGYYKFCSLNCALSSKETLEKKKITKKERYGDENYNNREKHKETCLKKYGYEHHWMNSTIRNKTLETWNKKYNVDNPSKDKNIQIKKEQTLLNNFNVNVPYKSDIIKQKGKETNQIRRGVDNPFQSDQIKLKSKITKQERYGDENYNNREKIRKTHIYNFHHHILPAVLNNMYNKTNNIIISLNNCDNIRDKITLKCEKGHIFERNINSLTYNPFCPYCNIGVSKQEQSIVNFLSNYINLHQIVRNTRKVIYPNEIDIYLPHLKIGIEFNGIYWHSEINGKHKNFHLNKTELCEKQNIQLIHIFENEWENKQEIIKSILVSKLNLLETKIYARDCSIKEVNTKTKDIFLESNHIQGKDKSSIKLGLFYNNNLVSVMTFGRRKITGGKPQFELIRFCNKLYTSVIGGASKLFQYFLNNYEYKEIITYADRRYSNGKFYKQLGFNFSHISKPSYWYFKLPYLNLYNRTNFQKHKLQNKLENFDPNLTEYQNMLNNGYNRIWDCGNYVFKYHK